MLRQIERKGTYGGAGGAPRGQQERLEDPDQELNAEEFRDLVGCEGYEEPDQFAEAFARGAAEVYDGVEAEMAKQHSTRYKA